MSFPIVSGRRRTLRGNLTTGRGTFSKILSHMYVSLKIVLRVIAFSNLPRTGLDTCSGGTLSFGNARSQSTKTKHLFMAPDHLKTHSLSVTSDILDEAELDDILQRNAIPAADTFEVLTRDVSKLNNCLGSETEVVYAPAIFEHIFYGTWKNFSLRSLPAGLDDINEEDEEEQEELSNRGHDDWESDQCLERIASPNDVGVARDADLGVDTLLESGLQSVPEVDECRTSQHLRDTSNHAVTDRGESLYSEFIASDSNQQQQQHLDLEPYSNEDDDDDDDAAILLKKTLSASLPSITDDTIAKYAETVCESGYRKIFAILVMLERPWEIVLFIKKRLCDNDLPPSEHIVKGSSGRLFEMRRRGFPYKPLACCKRWTYRTHEQFYKVQWGFISPFFAKGKLRRAHFYELSKKDILPWRREDREIRQGGYASISRVEIHPNNHNFKRNKVCRSTVILLFDIEANPRALYNSVMPPGSGVLEQPSPAVSGIRTSISPQLLKEDFERQIQALNLFSGDDHPHLISLLAENLVWMMGQLCGVASGLLRIHFYQSTDSRTKDKWEGRIVGRYEDIKPENILMFRDQNDPQDCGTLVITHFSLTKSHHDGTETYFAAGEVPAILIYQPPHGFWPHCGSWVSREDLSSG
ncbi:hypothetical protein QBC38DRAFT_461269 [Podospora fimiseda]|uniref:Uncharacterized protein n=1 Tax=Podospora fimiseda TaxID=252190 RepID=A0AAN6YP91_9PEZI|nr:hypothetical protein QBC38DRAFT_461269 [Podospora fimiseda]